MGACWQIQNSRYAIYMALTLAFIPLAGSFLFELMWVVNIGILLLIPIFFYLLYENISLPGNSVKNRLSWQNGLWIFSNDVISISGVKNKNSFSLGRIMFLSIKDKSCHGVNLWLFPDCFVKELQGWRSLHCCFYLSDRLEDE